MNSIEQLIALADAADPAGAGWSELEPLWVDAIDLRFQECRTKIPLLEQMAQKAGIDRIQHLDDVVPLLFAHTAYKSYPEAFIERGRWDRMNLWLNTLSKKPVENIDLLGVADADDWIARLHEAGHFVFATSGTSGKNSFLNQTARDVAFANKITVPRELAPGERRPIIVLGPREAPNRAAATFSNLVAQHGKEGSIHFLSDDRLRITDLAAAARLRRRIGDGVASPSEIAAAEEAGKARAAMGTQKLEGMAEAVLKHAGEATIIVGLTPQLFTIVESLRRRGMNRVELHPDTIIVSGGGAKGFNLPADHVDQIIGFFGLDLRRFTQGYGMQEASTGAKMIEPGRYEFSNWVVPLVLDDKGEHLQDMRSGQVTGRMALFDVSIDGRWGGIISGDRVTVDCDPSPTGRSGPAVLEINRYSELEGGDDKLTCAGTIDSFVRGAVGE